METPTDPIKTVTDAFKPPVTNPEIDHINRVTGHIEFDQNQPLDDGFFDALVRFDMTHKHGGGIAAPSNTDPKTIRTASEILVKVWTLDILPGDLLPDGLVLVHLNQVIRPHIELHRYIPVATRPSTSHTVVVNATPTGYEVRLRADKIVKNPDPYLSWTEGDVIFHDYCPRRALVTAVMAIINPEHV